MSIINKSRLKQYASLGYNVLFIGKHGVGKTATIKDVFTEMYGDRWKYFSASTLDPWVDFVGIPKIVSDEHGDHLKLIRPSFIEKDEIEAIFLDEFNRAPNKVINAVMELIQFKSINGHKLNNLKVIWAAINPEDEEDTYSVNHIDPAQFDRFQVHLNVPFKIDEEYFNTKYPSTASIFIQWWKDLPKDIQSSVSPRRLDYVAEAHMNGCRLEDFLPNNTNVVELHKMLKNLPFREQLKSVINEQEAIKFLGDINNSLKLLEMVKTNDIDAISFFKKFGKIIPKELVEPFYEIFQAKNNGIEVIRSLEALIIKMPNEKGNQSTAAFINGVDIKRIYANSGSLINDMRALNLSQHNLMSKLSNRCVDILLNCQSGTLSRILWGIEGRESKNPTNFNEIIKAISILGSHFTPSQKNIINKKLYSRSVVYDMNYL